MVPLVGLSVIVCESARYPLRDTFAAGWSSSGTGFTKKLMDYMENWGRMSGVLLEWMDRSYQRVDQRSGTEEDRNQSRNQEMRYVWFTSSSMKVRSRGDRGLFHILFNVIMC